EPGLVEDVCNALEAAGLNPRHLVLEVTETAMMRDIDEAKATLFALKQLGAEIAIDDFGTGFSSLSYLRQLPIDVLKIAKPIADDHEGGTCHRGGHFFRVRRGRPAYARSHRRRIVAGALCELHEQSGREVVGIVSLLERLSKYGRVVAPEHVLSDADEHEPSE